MPGVDISLWRIVCGLGIIRITRSVWMAGNLNQCLPHRIVLYRCLVWGELLRYRPAIVGDIEPASFSSTSACCCTELVLSILTLLFSPAAYCVQIDSSDIVVRTRLALESRSLESKSRRHGAQSNLPFP